MFLSWIQGASNEMKKGVILSFFVTYQQHIAECLLIMLFHCRRPLIAVLSAPDLSIIFQTELAVCSWIRVFMLCSPLLKDGESSALSQSHIFLENCPVHRSSCSVTLDLIFFPLYPSLSLCRTFHPFALPLSLSMLSSPSPSLSGLDYHSLRPRSSPL